MNKQELGFQAVFNLEKKNTYKHKLEWGMTPDAIVNWIGSCKEDHPTQEEINAEIDVLQADFDAQEYARNRAAEYPSIVELTVALYDTDDKAAIETKRAAVKAKYPKPKPE